MADSIVAPYGLETNNPQPEIKRYYNLAKTPYANTEQVLSEVLLAVRYLGQTFLVGNEEWWFKEGTTDEDLVLKENLEGFVPLSGTEVGKPITGDLVSEANIKSASMSIGVDEGYSFIELTNGFIEDDGGAIIMANTLEGTRLSLTGGTLNFGVGTSGISKGIVGSEIFNKQNDPNAFAQLGDITEATDLIEDQLDLKANDTDVVKLTGDQSIDGNKRFFGVLRAQGAINNDEVVVLSQMNDSILKNQITKSGNQTLDNTYNGKVVTFTGSGTFTVNNTIAEEGSFALKVETGVTVAWAITSPATWRVGGLTVGTAPRSLVGGDMVYVAKKGSSNEIEVYGL